VAAVTDGGAAHFFPEVSGALLAGGHGRRMGADKATLPFDGGTLGGRVLAVLAQLCGEVLAVERPGQRHDMLWPEPVRTVHDRPDWPVCALSGIHAALTAARHPWLLVMATDLAFPSPHLAEGLIRTALKTLPTPRLVVPWTGEVAHPLMAVYHRSLAPEIARRIEAGELRVQALARDLGVRVAESTLSTWDPELGGLVNVNTPEQLEAARSRLAARRKEQA